MSICYCKISFWSNHLFQASKAGLFLFGDPRGGVFGEEEFLTSLSDFLEELGNPRNLFSGNEEEKFMRIPGEWGPRGPYFAP